MERVILFLSHLYMERVILFLSHLYMEGVILFLSTFLLILRVQIRQHLDAPAS
jgi:hypothetical protein